MRIPSPRWFRERVEPVPDTASMPVSTLELFFDLVFVFTVTRLTHVLGHDYGAGALQTILMFGVIWWMYAGYAWLTNAVPARRPLRRVLLLVGMAGWLTTGLAVPDAFHGSGGWFALGMAVVVTVHGVMYLQSTRRFLPIFAANLLSVGALAVAAAVTGPARYALWAVAVAVMWLSPLVSGQRGFRLHAGHIAERHGLVVIVALGESLLAIGLVAADLPMGGHVVSVAVLGLAIAASLWWYYFARDAEPGETALTGETDQVRRARKVLGGYFYAHVPILLGIVTMAAAVSASIGHLTTPLGHGAEYALAAGPALFLLGTVWFRAVMGLPGRPGRILTAVVLAATVPLGAVAAGWQLVAVLAVLTAGLALERPSGR
ncbi:low temperature requirement protein LtrA [Stackebrandtia albiflava]|uniref:Low temperature requirement protein LtrA n=2 Tax=Stackebrandtia albiflava TaxID=406432 RepID=A0A562VH04_9ACTN|nr:low temperature requirement protein LtrA [Stackebrandtia albiflava]